MASGNMQQPLKTYMSYCVHIRVLDSHQELCYKKDHVLPCPLVGCLRTRSTASPLGQASILKGGNGLYQGLVQSVPNFHTIDSHLKCVLCQLTLQEVMIKPKVEQEDEFIIHGSDACLTQKNA
jgi:hypothetical protein